MIKHLEFEYKTLIDETTYNSLLEEFDLQNKNFEQVNYYFDTKEQALMDKKTILRIRKKEQYKLTKKEKSLEGNLESSLYLTGEEALNMINNGFDASIINEPYFVSLITSLKTTRAKTSYKGGMLFLDKSEYNGITDYEIEYEVSDVKIGQPIWIEFLRKHNIVQKNPISKSKRAFNSIK